MSSQPVYLDNAATTAVDPRVAKIALEVMTEGYGNPSSAHALGAAAARRLAEAREQLARVIRADPEEIFFTSGGTEANAIGFASSLETTRTKHVVVSALEHPSIAEYARRLTERGVELATVTPPR